MSVNVPSGFTRDRSYLMGNRPKICSSLHFEPISGTALTSSPHQKASTGTWSTNRPKVKNTVVAPWVFILTPFGLTLICPSAIIGVQSKESNKGNKAVLFITPPLENTQVHAGFNAPVHKIVGKSKDFIFRVRLIASISHKNLPL